MLVHFDIEFIEGEPNWVQMGQIVVKQLELLRPGTPYPDELDDDVFVMKWLLKQTDAVLRIRAFIFARPPQDQSNYRTTTESLGWSIPPR